MNKNMQVISRFIHFVNKLNLIMIVFFLYTLSSGSAWSHKEGEFFPAASSAGGRAHQLCEVLQLQQHEGQQDDQLHPRF